MRSTAVQSRVLPLAVACAALIGACSGEQVCTEEERIAVRVHVQSPFGFRVDGVTAQQDHEMICALSSSADDATTDLMFRCTEQGEGIYTIRVYSGDTIFSGRVHVDANECHTTEIKDVDFVLSPDHRAGLMLDEHVEVGSAGQGL
jgi:hypothetical protein